MKVDGSSLVFVRLGTGDREVLVPINAIKGFTTSFDGVMLHLKDEYILPDGPKSRCIYPWGLHRNLKDVQEEINKAIAIALRENKEEA